MRLRFVGLLLLSRLATAQAIQPTLSYQREEVVAGPHEYLVHRTERLAQLDTVLLESGNNLDSLRSEIESRLGTADEAWQEAITWESNQDNVAVKNMITKNVGLLIDGEFVVSSGALDDSQKRVETLRLVKIYLFTEPSEI